ncbi:hypothetical protein CEXT_271501 [Caerostris extrusa]|uniref:Uncharacterized protein n=1 Tax=Caerostris extrusa TaxID=172846 RepID=A0AAV4PTU7_CAEEX|nr:hypothetical protein CEXT_271501 [Caerostris extrusa]
MCFWQMTGTSGEWWCTQPCQGSISAFMVVELCCRLLPEFLRLHSETFHIHSPTPSRATCLFLLPKNFPRLPNFPWREKNAHPETFQTHQPPVGAQLLKM